MSFQTIEQQILIKTSRLTLNENDIDLPDIQNVNYFELFKLALYHKTLTLCFSNIKKYYPKAIIPKYLQSILYYSFNAIKNQNEIFLKELDNIVLKLMENQVTCLPVKGGMLIPLIYKDYGIRYMGDLDCLVKYSDINKLDEVMTELGYMQGRYNSIDNTIIPISRTEKLKWKMYMSNLHPYLKISGDINHPYFKFDFRFSLDDTLNKEPVDIILKEYDDTREINPAHVFIHLCTHFYNEAKHSSSIYTGKDFNLIKLCDIREFYLQCMNKNNYLDYVIKFADNYMFQKHIYFTLYCLNLIYHDGYEESFMERLKIEDEIFINTFGDNTKQENKVFKKSFWDRLFSCNNADELNSLPQYFEE